MRSTFSPLALARKGRTLSWAKPIAPRWPRSCDCSTACPLPSSLPQRACGCFLPRRSSNGCATAFSLLAGARGAAARHATLRAAIDWSWDLLAPWEQAAFAQCSIFDGGFTLEAAEAVLDLRVAEAPAAMDVVQALVGQKPASNLGPRRAEPLRHRGAALRDVLEHPRIRGGEA